MAMNDYALDMSWRAILADLGIRPADVLRRAGLAEDLLSRPGARVGAVAFYRFWESIEAELDDPLFPIRLYEAVRPDVFSPPLFAALCSPNLLAAAKRLSRYKPLIGPLRLDVRESEELVEMTFEWPEAGAKPPLSLVTAELLYFVCLARLATREPVSPVEVTTPDPPAPAAAYEEFIGVPIGRGPAHTVRFARKVALTPFLTANDGMWAVFEPELRRLLAELDESASFAERVRATLLDGLPSAQTSMDAVADRLAVSKRTLQRRLSGEGTSFQQILNATREALALHYLRRTTLPAAEISFLLGFEEPNSFYRAFNDWTGQTPEAVRQTALS